MEKKLYEKLNDLASRITDAAEKDLSDWPQWGDDVLMLGILIGYISRMESALRHIDHAETIYTARKIAKEALDVEFYKPDDD